MEQDENEKAQKIQIIAFVTNEKSHPPNDIINSYYLNKSTHFLIKRSKEILAFSTVFPEQKKTTKIMLCTLIDLNMEYEGIKDVNCYLIFVDLQKETSKEKLEEILTYINSYCNVSKKIFILGIKEEEDEIKISEDEISQRINDLDYDYFELNLKNDNDVTNKITDIFNYCSKNSDNETSIGNANNAHSCSIY